MKANLTRAQVIDTIVSTVKKHFIVGDTFDEDYDEPMFWSIERQDSDSCFRNKLESYLHEIPGFQHVKTDGCDSVNDVVNNNFSFKI
jgi:hypothetical protein